MPFPPNATTSLPVYIARDGRWFTGEPLLNLANMRNADVVGRDGVNPCLLSPDTRHHGLIINPLAGRFSKSEVKRIDVVFPALHGSHGEDGSLQGLLELADIPYVGYATLGSALTNDKIMTKMALRQANIPVLDDLWFLRDQWLDQPDEIIEAILRKI